METITNPILRGEVGDLEIGREYFWTRNLQNDRYIYEGLQKNRLAAISEKTWGIVNAKTNETVLVADHIKSPFGKHKWEDLINNQSLVLSFDACYADEYNCATGLCIPSSQR